MHHCIFGRGAIGAELTKNTTAVARVADEVIDPEYSYTPESNWNASYFVPVFADIKYSFTKTLVAPFVSMKGVLLFLLYMDCPAVITI